MPHLLAQAADDQFALLLCGGAVLLSAGVMFLTPLFTKTTGQIRLHQPEQAPEWSAGMIVPARELTLAPKEKAA
ncbi:MAG TPA: hypothetical protein DDY91_17565 [Planctomycetaceae bacterium]|nr:hypothetical protein [Planctomycetaceae bacterium]